MIHTSHLWGKSQHYKHNQINNNYGNKLYVYNAAYFTGIPSHFNSALLDWDLETVEAIWVY